MKIRSVEINNHRREFTVLTYSGAYYSFPYANATPQPGSDKRIESVFVDKELGKEGITYILQSGEEGSIHIEQFLDYNQDPAYLSEMLTYKLTLEAQRRISESGLSRRQIARRLNTSLPQLYRLIDSTNTRKSINQLVALLHVLGCNVDLIVSRKTLGVDSAKREVLEDHAELLKRL